MIPRRPGEHSDFAVRLRKGNRGWRAYDVRIGDTSLMLMWRSRFRRFYKDGGLKAVDEQLQKLAQRYPCKTPECRRFAKP